MKKYAQIYNNKAHWVFECEDKPVFAPDVILVDITNLDPQPKEGWDFDENTEEFTKPIQPESVVIAPSIEEQILAENQYQTALLEMQMVGGNV